MQQFDKTVHFPMPLFKSYMKIIAIQKLTSQKQQEVDTSRYDDEIKKLSCC